MERVSRSQEPGLDGSTLTLALGELERMAPVSWDWTQEVGVALGEVLTVMVQNGYARLLASQLHLAAIQDAYSELADQQDDIAVSFGKREKLKRGRLSRRRITLDVRDADLNICFAAPLSSYGPSHRHVYSWCRGFGN